ncbi:MAG: winged helix-turn-helix transcriptional regulator [Candidatus Odinarchaeota archaeon]
MTSEKEGTSSLALDARDYQLILALQENPLISYVDLSKKLDFISPVTIKNRIAKLREKEVINSFSIYPDRKKLGLSTCVFYLETRNPRNVKALEDLCNIHPYTIYYSRCYGGYNGLFTRFGIPDSGLKHLFDLFNRLKTEGWLDNYVYIETGGLSLVTQPVVKNWDLEGRKWRFNTKKWFKQINSQSGGLESGHLFPSRTITDKLEMLDFFILYQLWDNARVKQVKMLGNLAIDKMLHRDYGLTVDVTEYEEITKKNTETRRKPKKITISWNNGMFNEGSPQSTIIDKHVLSDRYQFLKRQGILSDKRIIYNRMKFRLFNTLAFHGKAEKEMVIKLLNAITNKEEPFPFNSGLHITSSFDEFSWWVTLDPTDLGVITDWFLDNSYEVRTSILSAENSQIYPVWFKNFDSDSKKWHDNREWIVDHPLKAWQSTRAMKTDE